MYYEHLIHDDKCVFYFDSVGLTLNKMNMNE